MNGHTTTAVQRQQIAAQLRGIAERLDDGTYSFDDVVYAIRVHLPDVAREIVDRFSIYDAQDWQ